jgi:hypothetical protein
VGRFILQVWLDGDGESLFLLGRLVDGRQELFSLLAVRPVDQRAFRHVGQLADLGREGTKQDLSPGHQVAASCQADAGAGPPKLGLEGAPRARLQQVTIGASGDEAVPGIGFDRVDRL